MKDDISIIMKGDDLYKIDMRILFEYAVTWICSGDYRLIDSIGKYEELDVRIEYPSLIDNIIRVVIYNKEKDSYYNENIKFDDYIEHQKAKIRKDKIEKFLNGL